MEVSKCQRCKKQGLPLLISRFAVGRNKAFTSPIAVPAGYPELPSTSCRYTLRNLRSGYLYLYDTLDNTITTYIIIDGGLATLINNNEPTSNTINDTHKPCMQQSQKFANAALITVSKPTVSRSIYIAYSEYKWTNNVLNSHKGNSPAAKENRKHMTEVKVGGKTVNSLPISKLKQSVNEYSLTKAQGMDSFAWSTQDFLELRLKGSAIIAEAEHLAPQKGLIVAINDPVALMADISALIDELNKIWVDHNKQPLTIYSEIEKIKTAVQLDAANNAALSFDRARSEVTEQIYIPQLMTYENVTVGYTNKEDLSPLTSRELQELRKKIEDSQSNAWQRYQRELSKPNAPDDWKKSFDKHAIDYQKKYIEPLAKAHLDGFKSDVLFHYMRANFDTAHMASGINYCYTVMTIVGNTQTLPSSFSFYCHLLRTSLKNEKNYLNKALLFNQKQVIDHVDKNLANFDFMAGYTKHAWSGLIYGVTQAIDLSMLARSKALEGFIKAVGAPVSKVMQEAVGGNKAAAKIALVMGAHYRKAIVRIEVKGTKIDYAKFITEEILKVSGKKVNEADLRRAVKLQLLQLEAAGVIDLKSKNNSAFALMIDVDELERVNYHAPNNQRAPAMAASIRSAMDVNKLRFQDYSKEVGDIKKMSLGAGLFATMLQGIAIMSMYNDMVSAKAGQLLETSTKFVAGIVAGVASILDVMERRFEAAMNTALNDAIRIKSKNTMLLLRSAKTVGLSVAAVIFAVWDFKNSHHAFQQGNNTLGGLYIASGVLGVASTVAFIVGGALLTGIGIVLVIAMIGVAFAINYFSSNELQDWLRQGYWGKATRNWSLSAELKQQQDALKALAS